MPAVCPPYYPSYWFYLPPQPYLIGFLLIMYLIMTTLTSGSLDPDILEQTDYRVGVYSHSASSPPFVGDVVLLLLLNGNSGTGLSFAWGYYQLYCLVYWLDWTGRQTTEHDSFRLPTQFILCPLPCALTPDGQGQGHCLPQTGRDVVVILGWLLPLQLPLTPPLCQLLPAVSPVIDQTDSASYPHHSHTLYLFYTQTGLTFLITGLVLPIPNLPSSHYHYQVTVPFIPPLVSCHPCQTPPRPYPKPEFS